MGLGAIALNQLMGESAFASDSDGGPLIASDRPLAQRPPMIAPRAKNVIYLHMAGSPPQHELFDYKPTLVKHHLEECPQELLEGKTFAFIKGTPKLLGAQVEFKQHGQSGQWISEMLPNIARHADDLCIVRSLHTDQFNHAPAQLLLHTGNQVFGGASMGA
jgi:hypothetical protein